MANTNPFSNQIISRDLLQQIFPYLSGQQLDTLLKSIDKDLQVPLRVDASSTPDLVVTIGPGIVNNNISGRQKSIPHIQNAIPNFTSGTITFPSVDGGTITVSPGSNLTLAINPNEYIKVLISLDSTGQLIVTLGPSDPVEANATVPPPVANCLPVAYISLFNNAGIIENISQNKIFQFGGGGGSGSGSVQQGFAQEVAIGSGDTDVTVVFPTPMPGVNYVIQAQMVNTTDPNPQFQDIVITNKTVNGFTANWSSPTDSANYKLAYIVPVVQEHTGEKALSLGVDSLTISLPFDYGTTNYTVVAQLLNIVDPNPQFQAVVVTAKTNLTFTVSWNSPTDSANYRLAFHVAQFQ